MLYLYNILSLLFKEMNVVPLQIQRETYFAFYLRKLILYLFRDFFALYLRKFILYLYRPNKNMCLSLQTDFAFYLRQIMFIPLWTDFTLYLRKLMFILLQTYFALYLRKIILNLNTQTRLSPEEKQFSKYIISLYFKMPFCLLERFLFSMKLQSTLTL